MKTSHNNTKTDLRNTQWSPNSQRYVFIHEIMGLYTPGKGSSGSSSFFNVAVGVLNSKEKELYEKRRRKCVFSSCCDVFVCILMCICVCTCVCIRD